MTPITASAAAKLNLTLVVHGRRSDGYHELTSLVAFAQDVQDDLTLYPGAPTDVTYSGPFSDGLRCGDNTVSTVLRNLQALSPGLTLGAVEVEKHIPLAAGLGGGSADAAALLRAIRTANPNLRTTIDWHGEAQKIGSDVPVCMATEAQLMAGRGEQIQPIPAFPRLYAVLAKPDGVVFDNKTVRVFSELNAPEFTQQSARSDVRNVPNFRSATEVADFVRLTGNDLLQPARRLLPALEAPLQALQGHPTCMVASLSGAGPTVFGLFETRSDAEEAVAHLSTALSGAWVRVTKIC